SKVGKRHQARAGDRTAGTQVPVGGGKPHHGRAWRNALEAVNGTVGVDLREFAVEEGRDLLDGHDRLQQGPLLPVECRIVVAGETGSDKGPASRPWLSRTAHSTIKRKVNQHRGSAMVLAAVEDTPIPPL